VVPIELAEDLADALDAAACGEIWSDVPEWWDAFEEQYEKREWEADEPQGGDAERACSTGLSELCVPYDDRLGEPPIVESPVDFAS
jgi:hypothetical protein